MASQQQQNAVCISISRRFCALANLQAKRAAAKCHFALLAPASHHVGRRSRAPRLLAADILRLSSFAAVDESGDCTSADESEKRDSSLVQRAQTLPPH